ncbi:MAG TPA: hypothetical protein VHV82_12760 [Sporichthyaceae bacterium]|jgi:hypothetical protein|nr:hypothetical protein [Sporichthyaceae bacterium]
MNGRIYGHTGTGEPIADEIIEEPADQAEAGYQPGQLQGRRRGPGRPPLGAAAKSVESVRLEPALRAEIAQRAAAEGVTAPELIRRTLHEYFRSA